MSEMMLLQEFSQEQRGFLEKKYNLATEREKRLAYLAKLTEELGEYADEVLHTSQLQRATKPRGDLAKEYADVIITASILAAECDIDIPRALKERIEELRRR